MNDNPYASPTTSPTVTTLAGTMRIRRMGVLQMAKISAIMYALLTAIIIVPMALFIMAVGGGNGSGGGIGVIGLLFAPILYGIGGFIAGALGAFVYNLVAGWVGGIELTLERA